MSLEWNQAVPFRHCVPSQLFPTTPNTFGLPGFTVVHIFEEEYLLVTVISMVLLGLLLCVFAAKTAKPAAFAPLFGGPVPVGTPSSLRTSIILYLGITGVFFIVLCTQLNKVVIVMAALHNWCEWLILGHLYAHTPGDRQAFASKATIAIWFICFGILLIPDVLNSFAFEEIHGLWPDFQLVISSWYLWYTFRDEKAARNTFRSFKLGATFHIAQIITLLMQGLGLIPGWPIGQFLVASTGFFNYYYYSCFALEFDAWNFGQAELKPPQDIENAGPRRLNQVGANRARWFDQKRDKTKFAIVCFFCSATAVLWGPAFFDFCVDVDVAPEANLRLVRYDIASSPAHMEHKLLDGVLAKRRQPGNIASRLYANEKEYAVLEWWDGPVGNHKRLASGGLQVTDDRTWHVQSDPASSVYTPPDPSLLTGSPHACRSLAVSGFTLIKAKDAYKDSIAIKLAAEANYSRATWGNRFYVTAAAHDKEDFLVFETWKSTGALIWHLLHPGPIRMMLFSSVMAKAVEFGNFREIDAFPHCHFA